MRILFLCTGNSCRSQMADGEAKLAVYRRVRDEIRAFVETLPGSLRSSSDQPHLNQDGAAKTV